MKTEISFDGTIGNSGDIQPDGFTFPDLTTFDPGIIPLPTSTAFSTGPVPAGAIASGEDTDQPVFTVTSSAGVTQGSPIAAGPITDSDSITFAPLVIVPDFASSITNLTGKGGDPTTAAEVEAAINAAINYYDTNWTSSVPVGSSINGTIVNTVSISIGFGYGTLDTTAMPSGAGAPASESKYNLTGIGNNSYSALYSALSGVLPDLPATSPAGGSGAFLETAAQAQFLGISAGGGLAGWVGLNSIANGVTLDYNLLNQSITGEVGAVGAVEHEISEVFGRTSLLGAMLAPGTAFYSIFDLYRFTAPNTPALTAGASDYFSLNNGTTALGYFNDNPANDGDAGDWASLGAPNDVVGDAYDAFLTTGTAGTISSLDTMVLDSIGLRADSVPLTPRTLVWTGALGTGFGTGGSWNDITDSLNPALTAPGSIDIAEFLTGGGSIGGVGTVAALEFGGLAQWLLGASSTLSATGTAGVIVGEGGSGLVSLTNGATIISQGSTDIISGNSPQGASVSVIGTASTWTSKGEFLIGGPGLGALAIQADGTVTAGSGLVIANTTSAAGSSVNLSGTGSNLQITGLLDVGGAGSGALDMSSGATAAAGSFDSGVSASAVGQIGLSGIGTGLSISGAATVADAGTGVLSVLSGATFSAASLTIGANKGSSGAVIVSGTGSDLVVSGVLNIGSALGAGDLTVGPSAAVHASVINLEGQVVLEGGLLDPSVTVINPNKSLGGSGTVASGDIIDEGILQAGDGTPGQLELVQGTIVGGGTLTENGSKVANKANAVGVLQINTFGTMEVDGAVLNAATTTFANDVTPTTTYTVTHSVIDVNFEDSTGVLQLDDIAGFGGTIATFQAGDQFIITAGTLSGLGVNNGTTLTMSDTGNGGTDQIIFNSQVSASYFNIVGGNTIEVVACFAAGTRIRTVDGLVRVEELRVGDRVMTMDGACEPIVWTGSCVVRCESHPKPETVWPVRIARDAFGECTPARDLFVSPDHAIYVDGVLIPAKLLINGTSIAQTRRDRVTYYHVELSSHAVILAEGLPVESYLDLGDRAECSQSHAVRLFPDFAARLAPDAAWAWETKGAAPLVLSGPALGEAKRVVASRASDSHGRAATAVRALPKIHRIDAAA